MTHPSTGVLIKHIHVCVGAGGGGGLPFFDVWGGLPKGQTLTWFPTWAS